MSDHTPTTTKDTETTQVYTVTPPSAPKRHVWRVIFLATGVVAVTCLALGAAGYITSNQYEDRILANVTVSGHNLSGMDRAEASATLQKSLDSLLARGLTLELFGNEQTISLSPAGATDPDLVYQLVDLDVSTAVNEAFAVGRTSSNPVINFFSPLYYATFGSATLTPQVTLAQVRLEDAIRAAFPNAESPGTQTDFVIGLASDGVAEVTVVEAVIGATIDMEEALSIISADVQDLELSTVPLALVERSAIVSTEQAQELIPDAKRAVEQAPYTLTHTTDNGQEEAFEITAKDLTIWLKPAVGDTPYLSLDREAMAGFLTDVRTAVEISPRDAKFTVENDRVTEFVGSRDGISIDEDQLFANLLTALNTDAAPEVITVATKRIPPNVPMDSINNFGIKEILGVGFSDFSGSPSNRRKNIQHGVDKLNGLLIAPGETLSLLEHLRPFTVADGYLPELVIKGDEIIPEIGGGLCQIGSTAFRAAMNSGLDIVERRNHSLVVSYYNDPSNGNPGTDATLYDPAPDLKIKNDTANYIMLATEVDQETSEVFFTFWGTKDGRQGYYTPPEVLSWNGYGTPVTKYTTSLPEGTRQCQSGYPGATTTFDYIIDWADGTSTVRTFNSTYRTLPQICLVGVSKDAPELTGSEPTSDEPIPVE
ncbi:VanW family protein [Patescibacteria group bacterium]|nr:VanW family protein [Patescibacteria group bacterium]